MARVLVASPEPIGRRLAGPAIRAAQIARVLSSSHDVTLVSLAGSSTSPIDGRIVRGPEAINTDFDAAVVQGRVLLAHPELSESTVPLAIDWFDPFHVEALHRGGDDVIRRMDLVEGARITLRKQAIRGDFFMCSNEMQREHWLGWLASAGRLNHLAHNADPLFSSLLAIAPFGLAAPHDQRRPGELGPIREMFSVVGPHDPVLLWAGGLHDWLDPLALVAAMPEVLDENPDTRLVFMAGPHPNTSIETMGVRGQAIEMARDMRLFGKNVLFVNQWIDYDDRLRWLADATVGVVADRAHLESRYSHRTRLLDHLAAGLPTVSTAGDPLSAQLAAAGAALLGEREPAAIGAVLAGLVNNDEQLDKLRAASFDLAESLTWEQTLAPLMAWLEDPRCAVDRRPGAHTGNLDDASAIERMGARVKTHLDDGGPKQVMQRGFEAARRRVGR